MAFAFKHSRTVVYWLLSVVILVNAIIAYDNCGQFELLRRSLPETWSKNIAEESQDNSEITDVQQDTQILDAVSPHKYIKEGIFYEDIQPTSPIRFLIKEFSDKIVIMRLFMPNGWSVYAHDNKGGAGPLRLEIDASRNRNFRIANILWPKSEKKYFEDPDDFTEASGALEGKKGYLSKSRIKNRLLGRVYNNDDEIVVKLNRVEAEQFSLAALKLDYVACGNSCFRSQVLVSKVLNSGIYNSKLEVEEAARMNKEAPDIMLENIIVAKEKIDSYKQSLLNIIFIAISSFIGGLLLNIMPCVLPVLSIKILSLVQYTGYSKKQIKLCFSVIFLGIIASFLVLAAITVYIKSLGHMFGWGMHFSNPTVLTLLSLAMLFYIANLGGLFARQLIPSKLLQKLHKIGGNNIYLSEFCFGVFITVMATPCTAPFIGMATTFALTHDSMAIVAIYTLIGFGLGFPYLIAIFSEGFIGFAKKISKKLDNIEIIKIAIWALAFASFIWLLNTVRLTLLSTSFVMFSYAVLLVWSLASLHVWIGRRNASSYLWLWGGKIVHTAFIFGFIMLFGIVVTLNSDYSKLMGQQWFGCAAVSHNGTVVGSYQPLMTAQYDEHGSKKASAQIMPNAFSYAKLRTQLAAGGIVIVTVGAEWCMTCKINENLVFNSLEVQNMLKQHKVLWLNLTYGAEQPEAWEFLQSHGRSGIPLSVVYGPLAPEGVILPDILRKKYLFEALHKVGLQAK